MWRLAVLAVPLAEIATFILVGGRIGLGPTLLLVVGAALAGALLLRRQGGATARALGQALRRGGDPAAALLRGGFGLAAAVLLIVPGFLGDVGALLILLPPVQRALLRGAARRGRAAPWGAGRRVTIRTGPIRPGPLRPGPTRPPAPDPRREPAIEAEWEEVSPPKAPTHRPSGWTRH